MENQKIKCHPNSKESEMMVLGCMLNSINSLNIASDCLDDSDFYYTEHKTVFKVLRLAYLEDRPMDVHLMSQSLSEQNKLHSVGGVSYIVTLSQYAGTSAYLEAYIKVIKDMNNLRRLIQASQIVEKKALQSPENVDELLDEAQFLFHQITSGKDTSLQLNEIISGLKSENKISFLSAVEERQTKYKNRKVGESGITGIPSGFVDLDKMINGLNNSNLMILAARPAMGKTALAVNIAEHVCFKLNMPVGIFSLEMGAEQLVHRIICSQSEVESDKIIQGSLSGVEYQRIVEVVHKLKPDTMVIEDQGGLKITELRSRARRMKEAHGIKFLVVDYLQLLSGSGSFKGNENRQGEVSEISRMLKNLAKELNIPILCLSQLSRKVEERADKRPMMSDLRESGSIEQDADIVMFLFRDEYYDSNNHPGQAQLIISKNRHGSTGTIKLFFKKSITQFVNYTPIEEDQSENIKKYEERFK